MKTIAIINQKGGTAKTTTALNLSYSLGQLGKKVLMIDLDSQANLTETIKFDCEIANTVYEVISEEIDLNKAIYRTSLDNIDIIPAKIELSDIEIEISDRLSRETILRDAIDKTDLDYDYIIIDCPPALSLITINALSASDRIIIPNEPSVYSLSGLEQLISLYSLVKEKINPELDIEGVLITRVDARTNIAKEFEDELRKIFGDKIFKTLIHQNVAVAESQKEELPILKYKSKSKAGKEYLDLAKEVIANE